MKSNKDLGLTTSIRNHALNPFRNWRAWESFGSLDAPSELLVGSTISGWLGQPPSLAFISREHGQ
jgi:hypothetical protein